MPCLITQYYNWLQGQCSWVLRAQILRPLSLEVITTSLLEDVRQLLSGRARFRPVPGHLSQRKAATCHADQHFLSLPLAGARLLWPDP